MRTAISVAALAAGALAVPYKREVVTDWDLVYVTDVVTVTAGQAPAAYTSASSSSSYEAPAMHYGHHNGWHQQASAWTSTWATTWTEVATEPTTTSISSPPVYTPSPSSTPEPETSTSSIYVAPTTSTTPVYQAPSSTSTYVAPSPTSTYVAPTSSAAATTSAAAGGYGSADPTYAKSVIDSHNLHRANHSAPDIQWDNDLYTIAMNTAKSCNYTHNTDDGGGGYGQNIAVGSDPDHIINVITDMFYNGEEFHFADAGLYGEANPNMDDFETWGHFTQVVWKDTTHVACYTTTSSDCAAIKDGTASGDDLPVSIPPYFTVCNYKNPGNFAGEYANNVGQPLGHPVVWAASESS